MYMVRIAPINAYIATLDISAASRLAASLKRTARGFDVDLVTPLISNMDTDPDVAREDLANELFHKTAHGPLEWLNEAESEAKERVGSFSIMLPFSERRDQVLTYFDQASIRPDMDAFRFAVRKVGATLPTSLRPASITEAFNRMPRGTNLGAPSFTSDNRFRTSVLELAKEITRLGFPFMEDPALLFWRGQPRGLGLVPKQRTVWGFPHYVTVIELQLQIAFLKSVKHDPTFVAWRTVDDINLEVTRLLRTAKQPVLSIDFSGYDASIPELLIDAAFELLSGCFQPSATQILDYCRDVFKHIPLATPVGIMSGRHGGVPSGSANTNLIDGLVQRIILEYCAIRMRNSIIDHLVQGDDGVTSWERPWDLDDLVGYANELGVLVSNDKGLVSSTRCTFLQNIHSLDYVHSDLNVGVRPLLRILNGMMSYERLARGWNGFDDTIRWWQQAENGREHPYFHELVKFLYEHDKYSRTYSWSTVVRQAGGFEQFESVSRQSAFPYGRHSVRGLSNFRVVRALDRMRHAQEASVKLVPI